MASESGKTRNLALVGHSGAGKTTLAEAVSLNIGQSNRLGRVEEGTTVSDYTQQEIERKMSIQLSILSGEHNNHSINIIDGPGYADFFAESQAAIRVVDGCVVVMDAGSGLEVGTERAWRLAEKYKAARILLLNRMDREDIPVETIIAQAVDRFGRQVVPLQIPVNAGEGFNQLVDLVGQQLVTYENGKASVGEIPGDLVDQAQTLHEQLVESVAETDEELMEKYFSEGELTAEELRTGLRKAVVQGEFFPLLFSDAYNNVGVDALLDAVAAYFPTPQEAPGLQVGEGDEVVQVDGSADGPLCGLVFKTLVEHHVGELSLLRIFGGGIKAGDEVYNASQKNTERIGQIFKLSGHERHEVESAEAGDLVALVKLKDTHTGNTLCPKGSEVEVPGIEVPEPLLRVAVTAKEKGGEDKMVTGLAQLHEQDPSFVFKYDPEIRQSLLITQGELHLSTLVEQLKGGYNVEIDTEAPKIPYRETVRANADGHYRHKKQSGGRGQFGEVFLRIAPKTRGEGFEFINNVVGGTIPTNFIPAVEKGLQESLVEGPVSGYNVVDVAVSVYDGKHHPVDSDEVSFKLASAHAFKDAFLKAKPVLLEPIYSLTVTVPEEFMGDVMGDLSSRRGRINGIDSDGHFQIVNAEAPLAEIARYATNLRSMTQGKGIYTQEFLRYEEVPGDIMTKVVEDSKKQAA